MKATVYFRLSTEGQRDALRRGLPAQAEQTLSGEIGVDDLQFFDISPAGYLTLTIYGFKTLPTTIDEALAPFRKDVEIKAAEKAKCQAEIEAWLAKPIETLLRPDPYRPGMLDVLTVYNSLYPDLASKYGKFIDARNQLLLTMRNEHNAKVEAENRAKEQAKKDAEA